MRSLEPALVIAFVALLPFIGRWIIADGRRAQVLPAGAGPAARALPWIVAVAVVGGWIARLLAPGLADLSATAGGLADAAGAGGLADAAAAGRDVAAEGAVGLARLVACSWALGGVFSAIGFVQSVSSLLLPLVGGALLARLGAGAGGVAVGTILLAASPVFVRDPSGGGLALPAAVWTLSALGLALRYREGRLLSDLVGAVLLAVLAMGSRAEALIGLPLALVLVLPLGPAGAKARRGIVPAVLAGGAIVLGAWLVLGAAGGDEAPPALAVLGSALDPGVLQRRFSAAFPGGNLALWPSVFPAGVALLAAASVLLATRRRVALAFLVAAVAWILVSPPDAPDAQVPAGVFLTLAAALGAEGIGRLQWRWLPRFTAITLALAEGTAVTSTVVTTIPWVWQRTAAASAPGPSVPPSPDPRPRSA